VLCFDICLCWKQGDEPAPEDEEDYQEEQDEESEGDEDDSDGDEGDEGVRGGGGRFMKTTCRSSPPQTQL
jgi:hypothetical protein